jgi:hypothetical protein
LSDAPGKIDAAGLIAARKRKKGASANGDQGLIVDQHRTVDQILTPTRRSDHSHYRHQRPWFSGAAKPAKVKSRVTGLLK